MLHVGGEHYEAVTMIGEDTEDDEAEFVAWSACRARREADDATLARRIAALESAEPIKREAALSASSSSNDRRWVRRKPHSVERKTTAADDDGWTTVSRRGGKSQGKKRRDAQIGISEPASAFLTRHLPSEQTVVSPAPMQAPAVNLQAYCAPSVPRQSQFVSVQAPPAPVPYLRVPPQAPTVSVQSSISTPTTPHNDTNAHCFTADSAPQPNGCTHSQAAAPTAANHPQLAKLQWTRLNPSGGASSSEAAGRTATVPPRLDPHTRPVIERDEHGNATLPVVQGYMCRKCNVLVHLRARCFVCERRRPRECVLFWYPKWACDRCLYDDNFPSRSGCRECGAMISTRAERACRVPDLRYGYVRITDGCKRTHVAGVQGWSSLDGVGDKRGRKRVKR
jgi:hypothetical protein